MHFQTSIITFYSFQIVIISYDLMTNKKLELIATKYNVLVFDESHMLKAGSSQRTKAATAISVCFFHF